MNDEWLDANVNIHEFAKSLNETANDILDASIGRGQGC